MMGWGSGFNTEQAGGQHHHILAFGMNIDRRRWIPHIDRLFPTSFFFLHFIFQVPLGGHGLGWSARQRATPFFVFSHHVSLTRSCFWHPRKGRLPLGTKMSQNIRCTRNLVPITLHLSVVKPSPPIHVPNKSTDKTSYRQARRSTQVSNLHPANNRNNTPSRPVPPAPYPTMSQESGNTSAPRASSCTTHPPVTQHHSLGWVGWRAGGLASEVGTSGVGAPKGSGGQCLGLTGLV